MTLQQHKPFEDCLPAPVCVGLLITIYTPGNCVFRHEEHCCKHALVAAMHAVNAEVTRALETLPQPTQAGADHFNHGAELNFEELVKLNHDVRPDMLEEGQTIILPAGKLSVRDREILAGIGPGTYRTYPVRSGETIEDIISKRSVRRDEVDKLNKDINLDSLAGGSGAGEFQLGVLACRAVRQRSPAAVGMPARVQLHTAALAQCSFPVAV